MAAETEPLHYDPEVFNDPKNFLVGDKTGKGSTSAYYQRRTFLQYYTLAGLAITGFYKLQPNYLRAASLGLIFPGGAYLANPTFLNIFLFIITSLLIPVTFFIWFASGAIAAPLANYVFPIFIGAYLNKDTTPFEYSPHVVSAVAGALLVSLYTLGFSTSAKNEKLKKIRNEYIPTYLDELKTRKHVPYDQRELDLKTLRFVQWFTEVALQDFDDWSNFAVIDQFQTASLRYQLWELVYALAAYQAIYAPSVRGKIAAAQRNAIEKSLIERVMYYWKWEAMLGKFTLDWDPIKKDNIMTSGYILKALALYTNNTGDTRYTKPDCLEFNVSKNAKYKYDIHSINKYVLRNWNEHAYTVFPCEPNWNYTACNYYASAGAQAYDAAFGHENFEGVRSKLTESVKENMSDEAGNLLTIKSTFTGFTIPGIAGPAGVAFANLDAAAASPELAAQSWIILKHECLEFDKKSKNYKPKGLSGSDFMDIGNYKTHDSAPLAQFVPVAAEHGDDEIRENLLKQIDEYTPIEVTKTGSYHNKGLSIWLSGAALIGRLCRYRDWSYTIKHGAAKQCIHGPVLDDFDIENVLVARAYSFTGEDLDLVLYNGRAAGEQTLGLAQLKAGQKYQTSTGEEFTADSQGKAYLRVHLEDRTPLHIQPLSA